MPQNVNEILARLQKGEAFTFERTFRVDRAAIDEESRTVNVAFASDKPIDHWFGKLSLSMDKKAMRSERLKSGAPLLMDHRSFSWEAQVGVIERFSIDNDGVARADVRFSKSARGEEVFQDVKDGIRQNISVGFMVHEMHLEKQEKDKKKGDLYRSDDWEPYEISIVSVPADISVGVGRSAGPKAVLHPLDFSQHSPTERAIQTPEDNKMTPEEIAAAAAEAARSVETPQHQASPQLAVIREINAFAEQLGPQALSIAETYRSQDGATVNGFLAAVRAAEKAARAANPNPPPDPMDPAEQAARTSGVQSVQLATSAYRYGPLKSFRGPQAEERAYRAGMFLLAALTRNEKAVNYCRERGIRLERVHSGTSNETGGFLVPDEFENVMIDLRIQYGVFRPNANVVPMTTDTKSRPRRTGGLTAYPIGAGVAITESTKGWDRVSLTAKKWGVLAKYENELSEDAVINIADDLASEIAYAFTQKEDDCGFNGDGTSTYHSIVGVIPKLTAATAGLKVATGNAYSEVTLNDLLGVVALLPQFARRSGQVKWYCSHTVWANVLQRVALAVGGVTHAEVEGALRDVFMGYPVEIVEVMPVTEANDQVAVLFGNLSQAALFGDRRGVTIAMTDSDATDFAEDQMAIRGTERFDINVHDVGNTSVAGPIVGLKLLGS